MKKEQNLLTKNLGRQKMLKSITEKVENDLLKKIKDAEASIENLKEARVNLSENNCWFEIDIYSAWASYGEKPVLYRASIGESLKKAAENAEKRFMEVNKRGDVQAERHAYVVFPNGIKLSVPYPQNKK